MINATKAIAYIRVSTIKQENLAHSLVAQKDKIEAYAKLYDLEIIDTVIETTSAKDLNREGLRSALNKIKSGEAGAIIVTKLDRLTRSVVDLGLLINEYFTDAGLLSVSEHIDTRSASGRLILNILTSVSQWEREAIGERTAEVKQSMKANGLYCGGSVPYGQMLVSGVLVTNPSEQTIISKAKEFKNQGFSLRAIASLFAEQGLKTRKDTDFSHVLVQRIVNNA